MELGFIKSKISAPKVKERIILRKTLFDKLDEAINYRVTVINAPAGYGKSTLLSSWLNFNVKDKYLVSWVSLDEMDDEPLIFWKYIVHAIDKAERGAVENSFSIFETPQISSNFSKYFLSVLISELSNLQKDLFIVIDDLHLVESEEIYAGLKFFIKNMPYNVHVILASREVPNLGFGRLRAADSLLEISQTDLSFSYEEQQYFFKNVMEMDVSKNALKSIHKRTEGWAAGLQMAALYLKGNNSEEELLKSFNGDHRYVLDYLVEEVFIGLDEEIQKFLLYTSVVDEMCSSFCNEILKIDSSQCILEKLENLNLFIIALDENKEWYRYHHLFKGFLRKRLEYVKKSNISEIYFSAAKWYENHNLSSMAVNFYLKANKYYEAKCIIEKLDMKMMFKGEMKKVYGWCNSLPNNILSESPRLSLNAAWFPCINGDEERTEFYLKQVEAASEALKDEEIKKEYYSEIIVIRAMLASMEKDTSKIVKDLEKAYEYSGKNDFIKAVIELLNGIACIYDGQVAKALEYYKICLKISIETENYYLIVMACRNLNVSRLLRGKLREGEKQCNEIIKYFEARQSDGIPVLGAVYNDLAEIYYEWNELNAAREYAEKAYELASKGDVMWIMATSCTIMARINYCTDNIKEAFEYINRAERIIMKDKLFDALSSLEYVKADILLGIGKLEEVNAWLSNKNYDVSENYSVIHISYYRIKVNYLISAGQISEAESLVNKFSECFEIWKVYKSQAEILILSSIIYEKKGFRAKALNELKKAVNLSCGENYIRIFLNYRSDLEELLLSIKNKPTNDLNNEALLFVDRILDERSRAVDIQRSSTPEILSAREIEVLNCIKNDLTNSEIAEKLFVSINTVKTHILNIYTKLDVHSRKEALLKAEELKLTL